MTEIYSPSRLNTAVSCEYKYYLQYYKKTRSTVEFSYFVVGNTVHKIIEDFYRSRISTQHYTKEEHLNWCREQLDKSFQYKFGKTMSAMRQYQTFYDQVRKHVIEKTGKEARPQATKLWKENFEDTIAAQAAQVNKIAVEACPNMIFKKPFTELYEQSWQCLQNFVGMHEELSNGSTSVIHEFRLDPPILVLGINKGGRVDRIDIKNAAQDEFSYNVYDYKTGRAYWKEDGMSDNDQLCWYSVGLKETFGVYPDKVGIVDLYHNKMVEAVLTEADFDRFLERLAMQVEDVKRLEDSFEALDEEDISFITPVFRNETYRCKSCEYALDPNLKCKFYKGDNNQ